MPQKETISTRVARLENAMASLAEKMDILAGKVNILTDAQIRDEAQITEMKKEALERERRLDERIDKLVSAIGELISRNGKTTE